MLMIVLSNIFPYKGENQHLIDKSSLKVALTIETIGTKALGTSGLMKS